MKLALSISLSFLSVCLSAQVNVDEPIIHYSFEDTIVDIGSLNLVPTVLGDARFSSSVSTQAGKAVDTRLSQLAILSGYSEDREQLALGVWTNANYLGSTAPYGINRNVVVTQDDRALQNGLVSIGFGDAKVTAQPGGDSNTDIPGMIGLWQHYTLNRGLDSNEVYVNGGLAYRAPVNDYASSVDPNPEMILLSGRRTYDQQFKGLVDEFRLYPAPLSPCEVFELYSLHAPDTTGSLEAHYAFDSTAVEAIGRAGSATLRNVAFGNDQDGNLSGAINFQQGSAELPLTIDSPTRTIALRVKIDDASLNASSTPRVLFSQDDISLNQGLWRIDVATDSLGESNLRMFAGGQSSLLEMSVEADRWYHLVLVLDGPLSRYYVDGHHMGMRAVDDYASSVTPNPQIVLGAGRRTTDQFFQGSISDVRFYSRALTDCEVSTLLEDATSNLNDLNVRELKVWPNPAVDVLSIDLESSSLQPYKIFDSSGRQVMNGVADNKLIISSLIPGVYQIVIEKEGQSFQARFSKTN